MILHSNKKGFSLLEIMIAIAMLGGISLGVMQMLKSMQKGQVDTQNFTDYTSIAQESSFLLNDLNSCKASLAGTTFHGSTIKSSAITGIQLWSADQAGARSQKKFYSGANFGKVTIDTISFNMPDYTATSDWSVGTNQTFTGLITISSKKKSMGHESTDKLITKSINVTFNTDASGQSTITSCSAGSPGGSGLGIGQIWKDMKSQGYQLDTDYTNNTQAPIMVSVSVGPNPSPGWGSITMTVGGVVTAYQVANWNGGSGYLAATAIVPVGVTYRISGAGRLPLYTWAELR